MYLNNYENLPPQKLEPGVYALSNNRLDSPWPKVDHAREQLAELVDSVELDEQHLGTLMATLSLQKIYAPNYSPAQVCLRSGKHYCHRHLLLLRDTVPGLPPLSLFPLTAKLQSLNKPMKLARLWALRLLALTPASGD